MQTLLRQHLGAIAPAIVISPVASRADQTDSLASEALEGIWQQQGYGHIVSIEGDNFSSYELTRISCL